MKLRCQSNHHTISHAEERVVGREGKGNAFSRSLSNDSIIQIKWHQNGEQ